MPQESYTGSHIPAIRKHKECWATFILVSSLTVDLALQARRRLSVARPPLLTGHLRAGRFGDPAITKLHRPHSFVTFFKELSDWFLSILNFLCCRASRFAMPGSHRYYELDITGLRFTIFTLGMRALKKNRIKHGVIFVFTLVLLLGSFVSYRHFIFTGVAKYITHDHELRRVLGRAERDNLRSGLIVREQRLMPDQPQQIVEVLPSPQLAITFYRISFIQHSLVDHNRLINDLSPVLNL